MMKPLLIACIENDPSLLPTIKMEEEIDSIIGKKIKRQMFHAKQNQKNY